MTVVAALEGCELAQSDTKERCQNNLKEPLYRCSVDKIALTDITVLLIVRRKFHRPLPPTANFVAHSATSCCANVP